MELNKNEEAIICLIKLQLSILSMLSPFRKRLNADYIIFYSHILQNSYANIRLQQISQIKQYEVIKMWFHYVKKVDLIQQNQQVIYEIKKYEDSLKYLNQALSILSLRYYFSQKQWKSFILSHLSFSLQILRKLQRSSDLLSRIILERIQCSI